MTEQVNGRESETQLSKLLEPGSSPDQRPQPRAPRRLGGCEELIDIPEDLDEPDPEIERLFYGNASASRRVRGARPPRRS